MTQVFEMTFRSMKTWNILINNNFFLLGTDVSRLLLSLSQGDIPDEGARRIPDYDFRNIY